MKKNYTPSEMSFADGFLYGGIYSEGKSVFMEVDKPKAIRKIKRLLGEGRHIERAELGLDGDWRENSGILYGNGEFQTCWVKGEEPSDAFYHIYDGSPWATPTLIVFYKDAPNEAFECYKKRPMKEV